MPSLPPVRLPATYRRLCRRAGGSLWLAPDHLFVVVSSGIAEEYRRVALRDIQGIFLTFDIRRALWSTIWLILAAASGMVALTRYYQPTQRGPRISLALLGIGIAGALWNHFLGRGCRGYLVTDVQTLRLPGFCRQPRARRVLRRLEEAIGSAQKEPVL